MKNESKRNIFSKLFRLDKKSFPILSAFILVIIIGFFVYRHYKYTPLDLATLINSDLNRISEKLTEIDKQCSILDFLHDRNYVDFLTVQSFASSEIGGLNLAYPKNWKGPYLQTNPEIEGKLYEIIKAKDGYFIVPGRDVVLPNNKTIGKEVMLTNQTALLDLIRPGGDLHYNGLELARRLNFIIGDWPKQSAQNKKIADLNQTLEEFNESVPYTKNSSKEILFA